MSNTSIGVPIKRSCPKEARDEDKLKTETLVGHRFPWKYQHYSRDIGVETTAPKLFLKA